MKSKFEIIIEADDSKAGVQTTLKFNGKDIKPKDADILFKGMATASDVEPTEKITHTINHIFLTGFLRSQVKMGKMLLDLITMIDEFKGEDDE